MTKAEDPYYYDQAPASFRENLQGEVLMGTHMIRQRVKNYDDLSSQIVRSANPHHWNAGVLPKQTAPFYATN